MLAEIFCLQVEAEVRASPFSDRTIRDPRFVPAHPSPPTAPADDHAPVEAIVELGGQDAAN